jgi:hypothetical protein
MKFTIAQSILLFLAPLALALPTGGDSSVVSPQGYTAPGSTCREFRGQIICARDEAQAAPAGSEVGTQGYTAPGSTCREFRGQIICARNAKAASAEPEVGTQGYTWPGPDGKTCREFRGQIICA